MASKHYFFANILKTAVCSFLLLPSVLLVSLMAWAHNTWEGLDYEQILANTGTTPPISGIFEFSPELKYYLLAAGAAFLMLLATLNNRRILAASVAFYAIFVCQLGIIPYFYYQHSHTSLYEKYYQTPQISAADFPEQKRNLLLLYLESMEQNFADEKLYSANLLPELSQISRNNPSFSGYHMLHGTNYTKAALVSGHCGIPHRSNIISGLSSAHSHLSNLTCLSDVLAANGYQTWFAQSADHTFAATDIFYLAHKYQNIITASELAQGLSPEEIKKNESSYGGLSDKLLLSHLLNLFAEKKVKEPFLMTAFTIDTHAPGTKLPYNCPKAFGDIRDNILCADKTVSDFLTEFQKTPYWKNTTVVIVGDHPMFKALKTVTRQKYRRGVYNVFLNLPENMEFDRQKPYTALDFAPTYLQILGIRLNGNAFGLGRSLFSATPGLISVPKANLAVEVRKKSALYDSFSQNPVPDVYKPYKLGTVLQKQNVLSYAPYSETILDHPHIDTLNLKLDTVPSRDLTLNMAFSAMLSLNPKLKIMLNGQTVREIALAKTPGPQEISLVIPKRFLTAPNLNIRLENNNFRSAYGSGIEVFHFSLR